MIGVGADWPAPQKLDAEGVVPVRAERRGGDVLVAGRYRRQCRRPAGFGNPLNIGNFDNIKQQYFNLKASYAYNKNWSFTAGYAYEKYNHNDIGTEGYHVH